MELLTTNQYNQGIGKGKLLSSTAGVGSIITTKIGNYILISDINKWTFVRNAQKILEEIRKEEIDHSKRYAKAQTRITNQGILFVDDKRFVDFLKEEKHLPELICLIAIPNITLNEQFNTPNWKNHPINKLLEGAAKAEDFMVRATHFPKWFMNDRGELKLYNEWKERWIKKRLGAETFVPPRDANKPLKDSSGKEKVITIQNDNKGTITHRLFAQLSQSNLILICQNGHLSDIPWPRFIKWKSQHREKNDAGQSMFSAMDDCCTSPKLKWTESKTKSEGYGSIYIECENCGCGSVDKINLEGINNLKPICPGHKPWEIDLFQDDDSTIPKEPCFKKGNSSLGKEQMQVALVTGNNVYYASVFSSIFIPQHLAQNKSTQIIDAKVKCDEKFAKYLKAKPDISKRAFWDKLDKADFIIENGFQIGNIEEFTLLLESEFLQTQATDENLDRHEVYRWQEYQTFCNTENLDDASGLKFEDIEMPCKLKPFFSKIQQVEELKLTQVQLDFTRVKPKERVIIENEVRTSGAGKNVFSIIDNELFVLPSNETFGEGLFFQFNLDRINSWLEKNDLALKERFASIFREVNLNRQGASLKQRIQNNGLKHFLIHTFSHLIMRELEFSCGYPTASLKERLYISNRMNGVLIFTAEGSEGSMGGLIWQGRPERIQQLIIKALTRAVDCSSDPLCWESGGQGLFDLNLGACFSCSLTSETACEEMNLGLDRRALIDSDFGFFKDIL